MLLALAMGLQDSMLSWWESRVSRGVVATILSGVLLGCCGTRPAVADEAGRDAGHPVTQAAAPSPGKQPDADRLNAAELQAVRAQNGEAAPSILGPPLMLQTVFGIDRLN